MYCEESTDKNCRYIKHGSDRSKDESQGFSLTSERVKLATTNLKKAEEKAG